MPKLVIVHDSEPLAFPSIPHSLFALNPSFVMTNHQTFL
jgi:hypothetical protein